ncbi:TetR/AcrR family transcriptional regulator [Brevundimonas lenta]|uniref:AcrR family transcriptional regulator n=1 Tax=Brevundimonas lenta TaxID=424796 RepID=A0A7W6JD95_9CAUL|nr:TetR/AcrR family transcriptional regulator [Brevundimonas lenta]MBB4082048.1 AcrR family transcriptional regulator [Brevundimonas lenta]
MPPKGAATRARLVDEAMRQVTVRGLAAVSLQDVAGASGVSKSAVLKHFQSKESLQIELVDAMIDRFKVAVWDPAEPLEPGRERLDRIIQGELDWIDGEDRPGGCPLMAAAAELDDQPGPLRDALKASQIRWARVLKREFRTIHPDRDEAALDTLVFQFKGLVLAYSHSRRLLDDETARNQAMAAYRMLVA